MTDLSTRTMLDAYFQSASPTAYFTGMFTRGRPRFHNTEAVTMDVQRTGEDISVVVTDLSTGYRMNSTDLYTNKEFIPPIHKEAVPLKSHDLLSRMPVMDPFQQPNFRATIIEKMFNGMQAVSRKIDRSIELQASQVKLLGVVTLTDINGNALYTIDYSAKPTHFPTAGVAWGGATLGNKISDIESLCDVIRDDCLQDPDRITVAANVWENLIQTTGFLDRFDARRADLGTITTMQSRGNGGKYRGVIEIGNYNLDVFTYSGRYKDPQTGNTLQYMTPGKVLIDVSEARMDASFGAIPNIGAELGMRGRLLPEMPTRFSSSENGVDLFTNVWMSDDGESLFGGVGTRPLMIPVNIDSFGTLTTGL